jgi:hypothetical protein
MFLKQLNFNNFVYFFVKKNIDKTKYSIFYILLELQITSVPTFKDINNIEYSSTDIEQELLSAILSGVHQQDLLMAYRQNTSQNGSILMSNILDRNNHTGTQDISTVDGLQTALDLKYDASNPNAYEIPAQLNVRDTDNRARANHTGVQDISTITGLQTALDRVATETTQGIIEIATQAEADTGSDDVRALTPLKLRNSSLATTTQKGVTQLATQTEIFNKNNTKAATGENIANDVRLAQFSVGNGITGLTQNIAIGGSYNVLTSLLQSTETQSGNISVPYKNISNTAQSTFLDEVNNKFLFPSNLYTYNNTYVQYQIRCSFIFNITDTSGQTTKLNVRLRRVIDNSIVPGGELNYLRSDLPAGTGIILPVLFATFVNSETDPFVLNGCYISLDNDAQSSDAITLTDINIRIFKY